MNEYVESMRKRLHTHLADERRWEAQDEEP
jgi:hypothetical protein